MPFPTRFFFFSLKLFLKTHKNRPEGLDILWYFSPTSTDWISDVLRLRKEKRFLEFLNFGRYDDILENHNTRHGNNMSEDIVKSRMEELEETVKKFSARVERVENENKQLNDWGDRRDFWVSKLLDDYPKLLSSSNSMVKHALAQKERCSVLEERCSVLEERCSVLELRCSTLTQELELQSLRPYPSTAIITEEEEKSLNNTLDEMLGIPLEAPPHISKPPEPVQSEFTATMEVQGAPQSEPTGRKRKAQEMAESGPGTATPASSSYCNPITFQLYEGPTKRPARDPARRAGRPRTKVQQLMTPPEEPVPESQVHEEEILVTEEQHTETISVLFESSSQSFEFRSDDYDYDLYRSGNWVYQ